MYHPHLNIKSIVRRKTRYSKKGLQLIKKTQINRPLPVLDLETLQSYVLSISAKYISLVKSNQEENSQNFVRLFIFCRPTDSPQRRGSPKLRLYTAKHNRQITLGQLR